MNIDLFDYALPPRLIAQQPLPLRDASRLLVLDKHTGHTRHRQFTDLCDELATNDVLIMNHSKVFPARIHGWKSDDPTRKVELLLVHPWEEQGQSNLVYPLEGTASHVQRWIILGKPAKRLRVGDVVHCGEHATPHLTVEIIAVLEQGERIAEFRSEQPLLDVLQQIGQVPLPPYIQQPLTDGSRYQTVYAQQVGSVAAPTAGLHFTPSLLQQLVDRGITLASITLHVGIGTFRPIQTQTIEQHRMHEEYFEVPTATIQAIATARQKGGRVVAVGTTTARTLETIAPVLASSPAHPIKGWTDLYIYPGYTFQVVDALLTNFHLPKSTLLLMISALAGYDNIMAAYRQAVAMEYRFFSFGDAMFIHQPKESM